MCIYQTGNKKNAGANVLFTPTFFLCRRFYKNKFKTNRIPSFENTGT